MMRFLLFILLALPAMAGREFVAGSSQLGVGNVGSISYPFTVATFFQPSQNTASHAIISVSATTNTVERVQLTFGGAASDEVQLALRDASGGSVNVFGTSARGTTAFSHTAAVMSSSTLRTLYVAGSPEATNTTSITVNGLDEAILGATKSVTYTGFFSGVLAESAVWDAALTASEILSLSLGASPLLIRPANLKFYSPLSNRETSTEVNYVGAAISLTNSPAASALHPRIFKP